MYYLASIFTCVLLVTGGAIELTGRLDRIQATKDGKQVESVKSHPDLAVEFDTVAQLKLASRKSTFHVGEMIDIDIALLNSSEKPIFFHGLSDPRINAQSLGGESLEIQPYGIAERATTPSSFKLIAPNEFDTESFQLLAGCDRRAFEQINSSDKDSFTIFNQNLFLNWGNACLNLTRPGTYVLTAEIKNDYVLTSPRRGKVKTAVGKIKSNPLKITIID